MLVAIKCKKCGSADRNNSGNCIPCQKERGRKHYESNKAKIKKSAKIWKKNNPLKVKSGAKIYREKESEKLYLLQKAWAEKNPEKVKERSKRFYQKHTERLIIKSREFYKNNPEKAKAMRDAYRSRPEYKEINIRNLANRRSRIVGSTGRLSSGLLGRLMTTQRNKCACCKTDLSLVKVHLDHIMPLALGGNNNDNNMQLLCRPCNQSKHAKHPVKFMQQMGYLL